MFLHQSVMLVFECPPVETGVARIVAKAEVEVVNTCGVADLRTEGFVLLNATRLGDDGFTDDGTVLTIDT